MLKNKNFLFPWLLMFIALPVFSQGFLHTDGKNIVDENGDNFIIRSIGTGNWMIMEGYMMNTAGVAGTQHEFRKKLEETIGIPKTDSFYISWLNNHFNEADVDSLAKWGFNTIRVALHYNLFTLAIEDEPIQGEQTWLETGFNLTDSLLAWCSKNHMYLILDMHGTPGGQGKNADISDYDPAKPSLWESVYNREKLVALWHKLAERYYNEPWIGGYDLINETNWPFPSGNNSMLKNLFIQITDSIREVDTTHIIFIEGNGFANDFSGLTPPWDTNLAYSFHKYWSYNDDGGLDWVLGLRDQYNVPLWLGECGENSNTWYTNLVKLAEKKNIGWSMWPVKKASTNNPLNVKVNPDYENLIDYWRGNASKPTVDKAYQAVLEFSENHRIENCIVQKDVIDALFRQAYSTEILPFKIYNPQDYIFAVNYDYGRNGFAYYDIDTADYHLNTGDYQAWNSGYQYRNDGVDIEVCKDIQTNGYSVGWINSGEWMIYSLHSDSASLIDCAVRYASGSNGGYIQLEANGEVISDEFLLSGTGSWSNWKTSVIKDVVLPAGSIKLKIKFHQGGINLNYIRFENPRSQIEAKFNAIYVETSDILNEFYLHASQEISNETIPVEDFEFFINHKPATLQSAGINPDDPKIIIFKTDEILSKYKSLELSYNGTSVTNGSTLMENFTKKRISNKLADFYTLPYKIQAEKYYTNYGFQLEDCTDVGGGKNTAYANPGDYLEYLIYVPESQNYQLDLRSALQNGSASIDLYQEENGNINFIKNVTLNNTGGWQSWKTQSTNISLPKGKYFFRIQSKQGEFNLNWFQFSLISKLADLKSGSSIQVFPNPANEKITIILPQQYNSGALLEIYTIKGNLLLSQKLENKINTINVQKFEKACYFLKIYSGEQIDYQKLVIY